MNDTLIVIFWILFIIGIYRLIFKSTTQGCFIIIAVMVVGNILIDKTQFENKLEKEIQNDTVVKHEKNNSEHFYTPTYTNTNQLNEKNNVSDFEEENSTYNSNSGYSDYEYPDDDEVGDPSNYNQGSYQTNTISEENNVNSTSTSSGVRIGAICNDGTTSSATGSGACSHHGGVSEWIYE